MTIAENLQARATLEAGKASPPIETIARLNRGVAALQEGVEDPVLTSRDYALPLGRLVFGVAVAGSDQRILDAVEEGQPIILDDEEVTVEIRESEGPSHVLEMFVQRTRK